MQSPKVQDQIEAIKIWQQQVFKIREELFHKRAEIIDRAKKNLAKTTTAIQSKHEMVKNSINEEAVHREASIRVNRALQALERMIETNVDDDVMERAIHDPIVSGTIKEVTRKTVTSEFIQSVQRQLVMQAEFINIAAHELRTPIMPILTSVEMLQAELGNQNEWVLMIERNALRLLRLTENILSFTKIEGGSLLLNKQLFDLSALLSDIIKEQNIGNENKEVKLLLNTKNEVSVNADPDAITRVVLNILDNALKFTKRGVILTTLEKMDDQVVVSISDSGSGINPKIFPLIFTKFATMSSKGTGLGLYICKGIIEAHGGKIWASNNERGNGATFTFSLPLQKESDSTTPDSTTA